MTKSTKILQFSLTKIKPKSRVLVNWNLMSKVSVKTTNKNQTESPCCDVFFFFFVCAEWNVPVSPVHALRHEVQPDVQGQPDRAHPGGGSAEHLIGRGERGLRYSCCHKGDTCKNTIVHNTEETHTHTHTHTHIYIYIYTLQCIKAPV